MSTRPMVWADPSWVDQQQAPPMPIAMPGTRPSEVFAGEMAQDAGDAPMPSKIAMSGASPFVDVPPATAPHVARMQTPLEHEIGDTTQQLQKLEWKRDNPWGTANNHPGTLGKIGHALSVAGNIAGDIFAPSTMAMIPGTQLNRQGQAQGLSSRLQSLTKSSDEQNQSEEETAALPQKQSDEHARSAALTRQANDQANDLENTPDPLPTLQQKHAEAVINAVNRGIDPSDDPNVNHYADAITSLQKQGTPSTKTVQLEKNGKPHQVLVDERSGQEVRDLGESGEKPQQVHVNLGEQRAAKNDVLKAYQPTLDSAERMNVMTENYEKAMKDHDQQAMLSLLANHLGMTMGLQKGARMTKDIVQEAQQSRPWLQGIQARFDKDGVLSGVTLSPQQMQQMVGLGQSRYSEDAKKSRATAKYLGATDDGPSRTPNASTIRYYVHVANGDAAKAKQLAADDGWSIP